MMETQAVTRPGRRRVVIVDDDALYLTAVRRVLARHAERIELVLLSDGERAVDYVPNYPPELIVLDAFMPGFGGIDTCRRLRAAGCTASVVITSSHMTSCLADAALAAGATTVIAKPVDLIMLLHLHPILGRDRLDERQQLIVGHLEIARNIARALARQYAALLGLDDVIGPAMVGLCEAAARFDWSRAEPFLAFATQRIRGAVLDEVRRQSWQGRIVHKRRRRIAEARWALAQAGEPSGDGPVAAYLGLTVAAVQNAGEGARVARDVEVAKLPSPARSPASHVEEAQQLAQLERARATLPEREATLLRLHYDVEMSLAQIARSLELTLGHVRHVHAAALARLRAALFDEESSRSSVPSRVTDPTRRPRSTELPAR